jgi:hypothetical protein
MIQVATKGRWLNKTLAVFAFVGSFSSFVRPTMIVVVQDKDGFWIGADSVRGLGKDRSALVCKLHETPFGLVAKDGNIEGFDRTGEKYSIDKELSGLVSSSHSAGEFRDSVRVRYVDDLWGQLAYLLSEPDADTASLMSETFSDPMPELTKKMEQRSLILLSNDDGTPKLEQFLIFPDSKWLLGGRFRYFLYSPGTSFSPEWFPITSDLVRDERDTKHRSLHQFGLWIDYNRGDSWIQTHQKQAIREVLDQATKKFEGEVGPPFSIVHVFVRKVRSKNDTRSKTLVVKWKSKGKCPSWTFSLTDDDTIRLRN